MLLPGRLVSPLSPRASADPREGLLVRARAPLVLRRQLPDLGWQGHLITAPTWPSLSCGKREGKALTWPSASSDATLVGGVVVKGPLFPRVRVDARLLSLLPALLWHTGPLGQAPAQIEEAHTRLAFAQVLSVVSGWSAGHVAPSSVSLGGSCFPGGSAGRESACSEGDPGSIPGWRRSPGEGNSNPLQSSCLGNLMDRGAWWTGASVHAVAESQTTAADTRWREQALIALFCLYLWHFGGLQPQAWNTEGKKETRGPSTVPFFRPHSPSLPALFPPLLAVFLCIFFF